MKLHTEYGDYNIALQTSKYDNGNLAVMLIDTETGEDYAVLTVNLGTKLSGENMAYIDTNNFPEAEQFIKENNLGEPTGITRQSGFCEYPLYNLNLEGAK